jgi:hypothetical protein
LPVHPAIACGVIIAALDLGLAIAWWRQEGVSGTRVLQSIAEWGMGPFAYDGGILTAVVGLLLYAALMCVLAALYRLLAGTCPWLGRHPAISGALYGVTMYLLVFGLAVPALVDRQVIGSPEWTLVCILAYMFVIGIPCALSARIPWRTAARHRETIGS